MTVSAFTLPVSANGNGVTTAFPTGFYFLLATDLKVTRVSSLGVPTVLTLDAVGSNGYTVADAGVPAGGTVTLNTAPASGQTLLIDLNMPITQETDYEPNDPFPAASHERALDKLTLICRQIVRYTNRAIVAPETDSPSISLVLPAAATRANKALIFGASGEVTVSTDDYEDQVADVQAIADAAAASAAAASSSAGASASSAADAATSEGNASASELAAAASAASAAAVVSSAMFRDVVFLTSANSPFTVTQAESGKMLAIDTAGGAVTINLPQISTLTLPFTLGVKKTSVDGNAVVVNRAGTDTIDGGTSKSITAANAGSTFLPDTDPSPDRWTTADFGASAGNLSVDVFNGTGAQTVYTLSVAPGSQNNTAVYISGVYQQKAAYSLSGVTLTFTAPPPLGTGNIEVVTGTTLSIGTPADGSVSLAKLASSVYSGRDWRGRNRLINGDFRINQYGTTFSNPANGAITADRWKILYDGTGGTLTMQSVAATPAGLPWSEEAPGYHRIASTVAQTGGSFLVFTQAMESVRTLAGKACVLSFRVRQTAGSATTLTPVLRQVFGTGGSPSSSVDTAASAIPLGNSSWTLYSIPFTLPSISGKTLGSAGDDYLALRLQFPSGVYTVDFADIQIEEDTVATLFDRRPIQQELALCQRYFAKTFAYETAPATNTGTAGALSASSTGTATLSVVFNWRYPVVMRATPSFTIFNPANASNDIRNASATTNIAAITAAASTSAVSIFTNAVTVANNLHYVHATASAEY